jgi:plastocyanin
MQTTFPAAAAPHAARVSALGWLSASTLAGVALVIIYVLLAFFGFAAMPALIAAICLAFAGLIATGWRWTPLLGLLPGLALPAMFGAPLLGDPGSPLFLAGLLLVACCALAVIGGVAAAVQNYRWPAGERALPRWVPLLVTLVAGAVLGAELLALVPRPAPSAGVSAEVLAELPALAGRNFEFDQAEIRAKVGETVALRLENNDPEAHFFDIDELNVHAPMPVGQTGVALFKPTHPGTYTFYCTPHYDKASGQGMRGTLIVE